MGALKIGTTTDWKPFTIPDDLSDRKIALLAQSNKGKTYGLGDILEEMVEHHKPFIAIDPGDNLWGLRVLPDGRPSGLQVVVIGGPHKDLPFEKDQGERMAELLLSTPVCAVIDVAFESGGATKKFMTDFAGRLMRQKPDVPPLVVLEECPTLIPQNAFGMQSQLCKAAVSKLAVIGGNFGYGVLPACQRPATMDKDVLSQCDTLIVMGITHKKDRDTIKDWMEAKDIDDRVGDCFRELGLLKPGEAWYWSPGEDRFERFIFRKRRTLHPREMRKLGLKQDAVKLGDMTAFVERARQELTKTSVSVPDGPKKKREISPADPEPPRHSNAEVERLSKVVDELQVKVQNLHRELAEERAARADADRRVATVREFLRPQYDSLRSLFDVMPTSTSGAAAGVDRSRYAKILEKAPKAGIRTMADYLFDNGRATRQQLATFAGVCRDTSYKYIGWMVKVGMAQEDGKEIVLRKM